MQFGVFYVLEAPDHDYVRAYREMLEQIEYAEELGFDEVWLAEHHGTDYGSMPSPQVAGAAVAVRTKRMRIGFAVSNITFDYPVRIAEDFAMVDAISGGRMDFGVGRGYQPGEFKNLGLGDKQGVSREIFNEALDIITGLWESPSGKGFSYKGNHFTIEDVDIRPEVVQKPTPPVFIASISPETFQLVAESGHNLLVTPTLMTLPELKEFVINAKRIMMSHGRDPLSLNFPMNWQMHIAETDAQAMANTKDAFSWYFDTVMDLVPQGPNVPKSYERYAELAAASKEAGGLTVDALREGGIVYVGTPQGAVSEIQILREEMGLQHLICWMRFGGLEHDKVMGSLRLFAEQVMPHFADAPPVVPTALR